MSLTEKNSYWMRVIKDIEQKARQHSRKRIIKKYDYAVTVPENLRKRLAKIMPYDYYEYDKNVFVSEAEEDVAITSGEADAEKATNEAATKDFTCNKRTYSEIEYLEDGGHKFDLDLQKPPKHKCKIKKRYNWYSLYVCQLRKDRVKWDSRIYNLNRSIWEKSLDERAEDVMNAAAENFTEWLNSLGSDRSSDISKEQLKALFLIEGNKKILSSIHKEYTLEKAAARTVVDKGNVPKVLKAVPKKIITVAFGRTIPLKDRPRLPEETFKPIATVYPDELLSFEKVFKGITHLRSTKEVVKYFEDQPNLAKPRYLVEAGLFERKAKVQSTQEVPLYELLKLKY